ncbi:DUF4837 family protein [Flavobacterium sp. P21]|uniref:DUF4837 family protein n=1 Tax=Flavobacterium sp. P21 TaxID=3423948 RepID=UPI003D665FC4
MNKTLFLFLIVPFLLVSCLKTDKQTQPVSGKANTISVIIDDQLWYGEVGDTIRNKFASPVWGLTQEEPLFTINQYPARLLEGFVTDSRSIIVVKKAATDKFEIIRSKNFLTTLFAFTENLLMISFAVLNSIRLKWLKLFMKLKFKKSKRITENP